MKYLFGWTWHELLRQPIREMSEAQAKASWTKGPQVCVAAGPELEVGVVPAYTLSMSARAEDVRVTHYTPAGSIEAVLDYETTEGRLFLMQVTEYLYPDQDRYYSQPQCTAVRSFFFRPDGTGDLRTNISAAEAVTVEEFSGVDVSRHWVDPITTWGDWDRIGTYNP